jgi:predicted O-linked N-acetylglucosamine transferase (SPINDLY family)
LEINPGIPEAHSNLGNAIKDLGRFDDARDCYLRALAISPDYAEAHFNLGFSLENLGRLDDAVASYRQAIALNANFSDAHNNLGNVLKGQGHLDAALASFRRAFEIEPNFSMARSNALFALHYLPNQSKETILAEARRFGEYFEALCKPSWPRHTNDRTSDRCLKIGYVSGDFREHAVAYFIEPVLANHDKSQMEIFCYSNSSRTDAFTDRLMAEADHWQSCVIMSDDQLARRIRADGIDILVDLAGHSGCNRLLTFARKPAPIQITYLGYPGTSGLSAMDYRLTDRYTEPEDSDADQFYTEKLLHLPDSMWCYRPAEGMPEVSPLPALTNGYLTFGSFNDVNKVDADCVALWAKLLNSLPASRLLMATVPEGEMRNRLIWQFSEHGVAAGRIAFCGKLPPNQFRQMLQQVDITLDPVRVNGATTTCESLWLGVPVLTLVGERFLSRVGLSILSAAQLPDFAAATVEVYIRTATFLANNLKLFAEIRTGLREHLRTTPLLDQQRFARNVESVYREIWQHWCTDEI